MRKVYIVLRDDSCGYHGATPMTVWETEQLANETRDNLSCCDPGSIYTVEAYDVLGESEFLP